MIGAKELSQKIDYNFSTLGENGDVKRWINSSVSAMLGAGHNGKSKPSNKNLHEEEEAISALLNDSQLHTQQLASTVEQQISQMVSRFNRTTLELSRMIDDTKVAHTRFASVQTLSFPESGSAYAHRLRELKQTQKKLMRCCDIICRAQQVEAHFVELSTLRDTRAKESDLRGLRDVVLLAERLYEAKNNLMEIRKIDSEYGFHLNHLLASYEQLVQDQLKEKCLMEFSAHDEFEAAGVLKILLRIGRAKELMKEYFTRISGELTEQMRHACLSVGTTPLDHFGNTLNAKLGEVLREELAFWNRLAAQLDNEVFLTSSAHSSSGKVEETISWNVRDHFIAVALCDLLEAIVAEIRPELQSMVKSATTSSDFILLVTEFQKASLLVGLEEQGINPELLSFLEAKAKHLFKELVSEAPSLAAFSHCVAKELEAELSSISSRPSSQISLGNSDVDLILRSIKVALCNVCHKAGAFFPLLSVPVTAALLLSSMQRCFASMELEDCSESSASGSNSQASVLVSLGVFMKEILPSIEQCKTGVAQYIQSLSLEESEAGAMEKNLSTLIWQPLETHVQSYVQSCQHRIKMWLLHLVVEKTKDYHALPVWTLSSTNGPLSNMSSSGGFMAPTKIVREFGGAIVEIPVALDDVAVLAVTSASNKSGMEELMEDLSEAWLDEIVCAAVKDFVEEKVLSLRIRSDATAGETNNSLTTAIDPFDWSSRVGEAWEQLRADINYLRNVISAVRSEGVAELESVFTRLQRTPPPTSVNFVVGSVLQ